MLTTRSVSRDVPHVEWNYRPSPDNEGMVRHHIVIVSGKNRIQTMTNIVAQLNETSSAEKIRSLNGKVKGTRMRYLYHSYDCETSPRILGNWQFMPMPVIRDEELYDRKGQDGLEVYLSKRFSE